MKRTGLMAVACAAALTVACGGTARDGERETTTVAETERSATIATTGDTDQAKDGHGLDGDARHFAEQAAKHGSAEVELGRLASERAQSTEVKAFGQMMVRDHMKSGAELKEAASAHGLALIGEMPDKHEALLERLQAKSGAEFDREYMKAMVEGHQEMHGMVSGRVDESRRVTTNGALETAVNGWATKTLPKVEEHLAKARQIHDKLEGKGSTTQNRGEPTGNRY